MSILEELVKDFLLKNDLVIPDRSGLAARIGDHLKIFPETRADWMKWYMAWTTGKMNSKIEHAFPGGAEQLGAIHADSALDLIDDMLSSPDMKPILDYFLKLNESKVNAETFVDVIMFLDYLSGNHNEIIERNPKRIVIETKICSIRELIKLSKLKINCGKICFEALQKIAHAYNPKLKIWGEQEGDKIGASNIRFNKCRALGDNTCSVDIILED